jgi:hypothetical protein
MEISDAAHRVLVNRMDASVTGRDLREGLAALDAVEALFLEREPQAADAVRGLADEQRLDILVQALTRGGRELRAAAAVAGARRPRRLASRRARRYLSAKVRRRRAGRRAAGRAGSRAGSAGESLAPR